MPAIARRRAADLGRQIDLREGDALDIALPDASFDTVVCTFGLCERFGPAGIVERLTARRT